jgi:hypothetical protein
MFEDDGQMETVWKQEHSLQAFLDPSNFKTYEELKAKLDKVLGLNENGTMAPAAARQAAAARKPAADEDDLPWQAPKQERSAPAQSDDADDEDLAFFKRLAS